MILNGWLSTGLLELIATDLKNIDSDCAFKVLLERDQNRAVGIFKRLAQDPANANNFLLDRFVSLLPKDSAREIVDELESMALRQIGTRNRYALVGFLEAASSDRKVAFADKLYADRSPSSINDLHWKLVKVSGGKPRAKLLLHGMDDPNEGFVLVTMVVAQAVFNEEPLKNSELMAEWIGKVLPCMVHEAPAMRRSAASVLAVLMSIELDPSYLVSFDDLKEDAMIPVETEDEFRLRESIRAAAEKWLKEQGE